MKNIIFLSILFVSKISNGQKELITATEDINASKFGLSYDITMYPNVDTLSKNVIFLDPLPNEKSLKIEFYATKEALIDQCNRHHLLGDFEIKTVEGYGYNYFIFNTSGNILSSKMGCSDMTKQMKNIASGKTEFIRYNSRLPIVVYTPKDISIKYKIWRQDPNELDAKVY